MQGTSELAQSFDHLDHVEYMISDRSTIWHPSIVDGTRHFVSFYIIRHAEGFLQLLKDFIWLDLLELATELVIYRCQHDASNSGLIRYPLQISVPD